MQGEGYEETYDLGCPGCFVGKLSVGGAYVVAHRDTCSYVAAVDIDINP